VSFDAGGSTVDSGSIASFEWNFGDGTTGSGVDADHTYGASGTYVVTLTTTSDAGASDTVEHEVTVLNSPPVAVAVTPGTAAAGIPASGFDASASHDANGPVSGAYWDFGDGSPVVDEISPTHTFSTPGTYSVTTTVFDDEGASDTTTASIVVGEKTSTEDPGGAGSESPPGDNGGHPASAPGSPAPVTSPKTRHRVKHKPLRCHTGFKRKKVHRKDKCVRVKEKSHRR
jgi:PKD repeat protein